MAWGLACGVETLLVWSSGFVWQIVLWIIRRCYLQRMRSCQQCLQTCFYLGEVYQMTEGRLCQVQLLDDRKLELLVQPKLLSRELLDLVSSHFNLKEKEYFGFTYLDDIGQCKWLQLDRKVLEHDFSKKSGPIALQFLVRFYIESISLLKDPTTVELFFLNAKSAVYNGDIEVDSELVFKLAAHALQESKGDYTSDENTKADLKKLPALPTKVLQEHPSLAYCEDRVIEHYKPLKGLSRGQAIVQYLTLVESVPTYGVHYYEVKDKQGLPWWLGISYKGIGQYDHQDKVKPRKLFQWKQLENLYFREKKFAVEVNDPHRRTVTKRTFGQTGLVIHTWYASHSLIKTIWAMAISQHQFYLNRKQSKAKITTARSLGDIASDLTENGTSKMNKLSAGVKNQLIMASNGSLVSTGSADSEMNDDQKKEKLAELRKKEREIQDELSQKLTELKEICLREAELTGKLPKEYPASKGETPPRVRKRIGTAFKLDDLFPYNEDPYLRNLESRFALQQKIVEAAKKLAAEPDIPKLARKKRRRNCLDAMQRLQEIEDEMNQYRLKKGQKPTQRASLIIADELAKSECSSLCDSLQLNDDDGSQRPRSRSVQCSPCLSPPLSSSGLEYDPERRSPAIETRLDRSPNRLDHEHQGPGHYYAPREVFSAQSSPCKTLPRMPKAPHSLPQTPVMPRNAYSSSQLRSEGHIGGFRHRSGSLESQSQLLHSRCSKSVYPLSPSRRSNSTEVLDDCSSYSSMDYCPPCSVTPPYRTLDSHSYDYRSHRNTAIYGNTGSMPNLVPQNSSCYSYQQNHYPPHTYYVTGYPGFDYEPCSNGAYVYESELEGHYNLNPSYPTHGYHGRSRNRHYGMEGSDKLSQNPYATVRPPRGRHGPLNEVLTKNMYKALVAEHLKGWYNRSASQHRDPGGCHLVYTYKYDRGSQHSLGYQTLPAPFSHSSRTNSFSSVSSTASGGGNWQNHLTVGLNDSELSDAPLGAGAYSPSYSRSPTHSRFPAESHPLEPVEVFDAVASCSDSDH
ncbi:FERM domain-containing protein 4B GRP1-binding protein GRSP1 [Triplophysa tibetana]|uniref:FERM domain-containing protein 4B GRP1-binding protein GRSP1 n=1 Tax=Triplophysa tibetana TaxID=1572043 RepID=A0A5A9NAI0_9TELE|nr:FERM domain-containing protein 4B GRP1-binding protein GRSP1 [Triplophysa tibetana]